MKNTSLLFLLIGASGISACATVGGDQLDNAPPIGVVEEKIADAVTASAAANKAIAEVEVATAAPVRAAPGATVPPNVILPPEAVEPITIDWDGPVETFLAAIAVRSGYKMTVSGRPPANQVMVTITAENEPLYRLVREAGNQVHGYADISLNPTAGTLELRYGG